MSSDPNTTEAEKIARLYARAREMLGGEPVAIISDDAFLNVLAAGVPAARIRVAKTLTRKERRKMMKRGHA